MDIYGNVQSTCNAKRGGGGGAGGEMKRDEERDEASVSAERVEEHENAGPFSTLNHLSQPRSPISSLTSPSQAFSFLASTIDDDHQQQENKLRRAAV